MLFPELTSIKTRRQKLGIKQKEFAQLTGVSQSLIAKLEKHRLEPSYSIAKRIFLTLEKLEHKEEKKCSDIMSRKVIVLNQEDNIKKASELIKKHAISQIPILDKKRRIIGTITEALIFNKILEGFSKKRLFEMKVEDISEEPLPTIRPDFPLSIILPLLKSSSAILVLEKQKIKGIITKADLL